MGIYKVFIQTEYQVKDIDKVDTDDPIALLDKYRKKYARDSYVTCVGIRKAELKKPKVGLRNEVVKRIRKGKLYAR